MFVSVFSAQLGSPADSCTASVYGAFEEARLTQLQYSLWWLMSLLAARADSSLYCLLKTVEIPQLRLVVFFGPVVACPLCATTDPLVDDVAQFIYSLDVPVTMQRRELDGGFRAVYTGTRPGLTPAIRAEKGWRGRRELAPRCSATLLAARRLNRHGVFLII